MKNLATDFTAMQTEGDGLWQIEAWLVTDFIGYAQRHRSARTDAMLQTLLDAHRATESSPCERPMCLTCDHQSCARCEWPSRLTGH